MDKLHLDRRVGLEAWTFGGANVPALLREAARMMEEYKRFFVHDVALASDDVGDWLILYGEWMDDVPAPWNNSSIKPSLEEPFVEIPLDNLLELEAVAQAARAVRVNAVGSEWGSEHTIAKFDNDVWLALCDALDALDGGGDD